MGELKTTHVNIVYKNEESEELNDLPPIPQMSNKTVTADQFC